MPKKIYLALAIHNHQPVGNFDFVFAEACERAYLPMIEALEKHPKIHVPVARARAKPKCLPKQ